MRIQFKIKDKKWVLTSDKSQFILNIETAGVDEKTGLPVLRAEHFYPRMELLLEDLYLMGLRNNKVDSFRALAKHSEEIRDIVKDISKKLSFEIGN